MRRRKRKRRNKPFIVDVEKWKALEFLVDKITLEHERLEVRRIKRYEKLQKAIHKRGREALRGYLV